MGAARLPHQISRSKHLKHTFTTFSQYIYLQLIQVDERLSKIFDTNVTHLSSTLTLNKVTAMDTGNFRFIYGDVELKQYVYVFGWFLLTCLTMRNLLTIKIPGSCRWKEFGHHQRQELLSELLFILLPSR